ncbi:hypothetical protein KEM56_005729 [Ascosphaera pollenicola]|nr:hypothetical protein KEM56_005729 [Ascosphaera pollenicola]
MDPNTVSEPTTVQQAPLEEQATNVHHTVASEGTTTDQNLKAATVHSMEYHRLGLKEKIESGEQGNSHYISPSDGIMSPATQKLSNIKGKRFQNAGKKQNLFAKALGKKVFESKLSAATNPDPSAATENAENVGKATN